MTTYDNENLSTPASGADSAEKHAIDLDVTVSEAAHVKTVDKNLFMDYNPERHRDSIRAIITCSSIGIFVLTIFLASIAAMGVGNLGLSSVRVLPR